MTPLLIRYWRSARPWADLTATYGLPEARIRDLLTRPWVERPRLNLEPHELRRMLAIHGGVNAASRATGIAAATLSVTARRLGVETKGRGGPNNPNGRGCWT